MAIRSHTGILAKPLQEGILIAKRIMKFMQQDQNMKIETSRVIHNKDMKKEENINNQTV
jgi:hypothetical protein